MTIESYSPDKLDQCALRLLDIAADLREIARESRKKDINGVPLHDKKALLWIENLESWAKKSKLNFEFLARDR